MGAGGVRGQFHFYVLRSPGVAPGSLCALVSVCNWFARFLFSAGRLIMFHRAVKAAWQAYLCLTAVNDCYGVHGNDVFYFAKAVEDGHDVPVAVNRFGNIRYLAREAGLVCFSGGKVNASRLCAFQWRFRVNRGRIVSCGLAAVSGPLHRFLPSLPIIFARAIFSEIGQVLVGRFFRVDRLFV